MKTSKETLSLRELQLWMKWVIVDPRGVQEALAHPFPKNIKEPTRYTSPEKSGLPWINQSEPLSVIDRLNIYAEAYFIRIYESMKSDFPITSEILGEISFKKLVADYIKKFPSTQHNITEIGKYFSDFVSNYKSLKKLAFLPAIVQTEWLILESFFSKNTGILNPSKFLNFKDEDWENASFLVADSTRLLESIWPLEQIYKKQITFNEIEHFENPNYFILIRENGTVFIETLTKAEFLILSKLKHGETLLQSLQTAQAECSDDEIGNHLMNWFHQWTHRGIIYDFNINTKKANL